MPTLPHRNQTPGRDVTRAGGSDWHKARVECNVLNINFSMAAQAR
jgi:hypothetical protein